MNITWDIEHHIVGGCVCVDEVWVCSCVSVCICVGVGGCVYVCMYVCV